MYFSEALEPHRLSLSTVVLISGILGWVGHPERVGAQEKPVHEDAGHEFDTYQFVLLKRPSSVPSIPEDEVEEIQSLHLAHLARLTKTGQLAVAGPFGDQEDESLRGLAIYRVGSLEEARRLAEADPAVQAGRLEVEIMTWYTLSGALEFPGGGEGELPSRR